MTALAKSGTGAGVHVIDDPARFAAMRAEWNELVDESGAAVFSGWEWLYAWYHRIAPGVRLHILTSRDENERLAGLMPLYLEERWAAGRKVRRLAFLGDKIVSSEYLDIIARPEQREAVAQSFVGRLVDSRAEWDVLDLLDIDSESPTLALLHSAFGDSGYEVEVTERSSQPYERLEEAGGYEAYMRKSKRRKNCVKQRQWLERQPGFEIVRETEPGRAAEALAGFMRLHEMRWAGGARSDAITGPDVEAFHRDAAELLAERGLWHLYTMRVGGQAVASALCLADSRKLYGYLTGRDPAWNKRSVSAVLTAQTFKDAFERGLSECDMLSGPEPWKLDWASSMRHSLAVRIYPATGAGSWLARQDRAIRALRTFAKTALRDGLLRRLKKSEEALGPGKES